MRGAGSGLGLAIVAEVAQLHGAYVAIDSGPQGKGTAVRITFQQPNPGSGLKSLPSERRAP